jgi:hypothetical protein
MPIAEFLSGYRFDRESERVLGIAFEMAASLCGPETATSNKRLPQSSSRLPKPVNATPIFCAKRC